jgi:protoheme IX farnesyltransferase
MMQKLSFFLALAKPRLSFLVVFSAAMGYAFSENSAELPNIYWLYLVLGGFFVTASANGFNQVLEREIDAKMARTENRPLPRKKISLNAAIAVCIIYGTIGLFFLYLLNQITLYLGLVSLVLYAFVYTPLKKHTAWSVLVGAIPGAMPPLLGYVAAENQFGIVPGLLFFMQFMWQFPHFWSIAWVGFEDYQKADYYLLPLPGGKSKQNAFMILLYTALLVPCSLFLWVFPIENPILGDLSACLVLLMGLLFVYVAYLFYNKPEQKEAKTLMFASFLYLPIVQIIYLLK